MTKKRNRKILKQEKKYLQTDWTPISTREATFYNRDSISRDKVQWEQGKICFYNNWTLKM